MTREEAISEIIKVGAEMLTSPTIICLDDLKLPSSTPLYVRRQIRQEEDRLEGINRHRAMRLKQAHDVLKKN